MEVWVRDEVDVKQAAIWKRWEPIDFFWTLASLPP